LPGYKSIDTVGDIGEAEQTHSHVPQYAMTVPLGQQLRAIIHILEEQKTKDAEYKVIVFFPTARQTGYYAYVLNSIGFEVLEIHSRKSQSQRTRTSDTFRYVIILHFIDFLFSFYFSAGKRMILLSSDVSARGMDYPDVSFVLQVGMTTKDQYIHR
jgi:ATP-dependent RNA helicase MSS116